MSDSPSFDPGRGPHPHAAPTRVRYLVLSLACGISFLLYLHRYVWGFVRNDVGREFGWNLVTLGWLDGLFPISYGLGQVPSGVLCDWFGAHLLLGGSVLLWSLALGLVAVAGTFASMAMARVTLGVAQASCYPVLNKVSKNWFPLEMRTTAQGLIATFFGRTGGAASFFLFGTVLIGWLGLSWRGAVCVVALFGLACGGLYLLLFRNTPAQHPWANLAEAELITAKDPEAAVATGSVLSWSALFGSVTVWFLFLRAVLSNMADVLYVNWVPQYLSEHKGLDVGSTGWMAALPLLGGAIGGLASGVLQSYLIRRTGKRRLARGSVGGGGKLLAAGLMTASLFLERAALVAVAFLVVKFFSDMEQPAEWGTVSDIAGPNSATVFACVNTLGSAGGALAGPLIGMVLHYSNAGGLPTAAGWNMVFTLIALEYLAAASCWLFIDNNKSIAQATPAKP